MPLDRRYFVENNKETVIAVNLKCGYSTINHALIQSNPSPLHDYSAAPARDVAEAKRVVLFVREPQSRFKSFFRNWIVDKFPGTDENQTIYNNFAHYLRDSDMQRLSETPREDRNTPEFISFFLTAVGPAFIQERHMSPQWYLLQKYHIPIGQITEIRNYRENTAFLEAEYGIKPEVRNVTRAHGPDPLDCPELESFCKVMYARDYEMFGDHF